MSTIGTASSRDTQPFIDKFSYEWQNKIAVATDYNITKNGDPNVKPKKALYSISE